MSAHHTAEGMQDIDTTPFQEASAAMVEAAIVLSDVAAIGLRQIVADIDETSRQLAEKYGVSLEEVVAAIGEEERS